MRALHFYAVPPMHVFYPSILLYNALWIRAKEKEEVQNSSDSSVC